MGSLSCSADVVVSYILSAFSVLLVVRALLSWVPSLRGRWSIIVDRVTDPVIEPVNRLIPPIGGFSIAFILVLLASRWLAGQFMNLANTCYLHVGG